MNKRELKDLIKECIKEIVNPFNIIDIDDNITATLIKADSTLPIEEISPKNKNKFSIDELKKILGGELDVISTKINNYEIYIVYNPNERKHFNFRATDLLASVHKKNFYGDILICKPNQISSSNINEKFINEFIDLTKVDRNHFDKNAALLIKAGGNNSINQEPIIQEIFPKMVRFNEEELIEILGGEIEIKKISKEELNKIFYDNTDIENTIFSDDIFLVFRKYKDNLNPNNLATDMLANITSQLYGDVLICKKNQINQRYHI